MKSCPGEIMRQYAGRALFARVVNFGSLEHNNTLYEYALPLCIFAIVLRCRAPIHALQQDGRNTRSLQERTTLRTTTSAILDLQSHKGPWEIFRLTPLATVQGSKGFFLFGEG